VSMMPLSIIESLFGSFALRDCTFVIKTEWKTIWTETTNRTGG